MGSKLPSPCLQAKIREIKWRFDHASGEDGTLQSAIGEVGAAMLEYSPR